jgi:hypothetical protein
MCVKGSAYGMRRGWESYGPLDARGYLWQVMREAPTPFPSRRPAVRRGLSFVLHAGRPPFDPCAQDPHAGEEWVLAGRQITKRTGVRVLPYDLPKATTRVKGPVGFPACLVFRADPLTRVVGGTQVIREDTKRHRCRRCRADSVGTAAFHVDSVGTAQCMRSLGLRVASG